MSTSSGSSKKILIISDCINSYKIGGGARTSIINFITTFKDDFDLAYISLEFLGKKNYMLEKTPFFDGVEGFYPLGKLSYAFFLIRRIIGRDDGVVYLNGFYSKYGSLLPLILIKLLGFFVTVPQLVIAPRGGVSSGAMALKIKRKIIYFRFLKLFRLLKGVRFHVVSELEKDALCTRIGEQYRQFCFTAANVVVPKPEIKEENIELFNNRVRLVFLARIHPIKNLGFLVNVLDNIDLNVEFDIYGTVDDQEYLEKSILAFDTVNNGVKVSYCGEVEQSEVVRVLSKYDLYLLPTLGENFGHTIFESLDAKTPVLVSDKTPWRGKDFEGLWDLSIESPKLWREKITEYCYMSDAQKRKLREQAGESAKKWVDQQNYKQTYFKLFQFS
jgi:glycosyltransferase involved in cell wall biosynthesis